MWPLTGLARCVPQLAAWAAATAVATARKRREKATAVSSDRDQKDAGFWLSSHSARATLVLMTIQASCQRVSMRLKEYAVATCTDLLAWRPIGRFLGAGFDRRLLALRQALSRRDADRPGAHLSCRADSRTSARCLRHVIDRCLGFYTYTTHTHTPPAASQAMGSHCWSCSLMVGMHAQRRSGSPDQ